MTDSEADLWRRTLELPKVRYAGDLAPLVELLPENSVVAELGSFSGESAIQFLASFRVRKLICVDQWVAGYDDEADLASRADMEAAQAAFRIRVKQYLDSVVVLQYLTIEAAQHVHDGSLDMLYVDADHRYEGVVADLRAWIPKVKPGGWIAGHDYDCPGHPDVKRAVDEVIGVPDHLFPDTSWAKRVEAR